MRKFVRISGVTIALSMVSVAVRADENSLYHPGAICVPMNGANFIQYVGTFGECKNASSTEDLSVSCPLTHNPDGNDFYRIWIDVWDGNNEEILICTGFATGTEPPYTIDTDQAWSTTTYAGRNTLLVEVDGDGNDPVYHVTCVLPDGDSGCSGCGESYISSISVLAF